MRYEVDFQPDQPPMDGGSWVVTDMKTDEVVATFAGDGAHAAEALAADLNAGEEAA